eukprot:4808344-Prymnesium_polylepis.1
MAARPAEEALGSGDPVERAQAVRIAAAIAADDIPSVTCGRQRWRRWPTGWTLRGRHTCVTWLRSTDPSSTTTGGWRASRQTCAPSS